MTVQKTRLPISRVALWLAIWTGIGLVFGAQNYLTSHYSEAPYSWSQALGLALLEWYYWGLAFPLLVAVAGRYPFEGWRWVRSLAVHLPLALMLTFGRLALEGFVIAGTGFAPLRDPALLLNSSLLTCSLVFGAAHALSYARISRNRRERALGLEASLAKARLQVLQARLQPHFLFNTLHSISTLMRRDVEAAETMLVQLSDLLRMALERSDQEQIPLQTEVDFIEKYLDIQQVRFGDRMRVGWSVESETRQALVPSMIIQPLVENAIVHGIAPRREGGLVGIGARRVGDWLEVSVSDDGPGFQDSGVERSGHGLSLTADRLRHHYGDQQRFDVVSEGGVGLVARVRVPYREERAV